MQRIIRVPCKTCDGFLVDGRHYGSGVWNKKKETNIKGPNWTDKEIRMMQKYDKNMKAGKEVYYTYDDGTDMIDWLGVDDKNKQAYKMTRDEYGNKTYHYRGKPKEVK